MGHVDALSRCFHERDCNVVAAIDCNELDTRLQLTQGRDSNIRKLMTELQSKEVSGYELIDGLLFRKDHLNKLMLYVPKEMEENVIRAIHEKIGHLGAKKCYDQIRFNYWFPNMKDKIDSYIKNCIKCIVYSAPARISEQNLYSIPKKPIPFHTIHIDHFGPLPSLSSKRKHILVVIDAFTKFVRLYPVNSTSTKEVCCALEKYFSYYSRPKQIISDRGSCFTSHEFTDFVLRNSIDHIKVAVSSPQANGQVERVNRVLKAILSKISDPLDHANWSLKLSEVEYAINNTIHSSTKDTPSRLLFGVKQRGRIVDELTEYLDDKLEKNNCIDLTSQRLKALGAIERSQEYNENYFYKHHVPAKQYLVGDYVVVMNTDNTVGKNKKFIEKYRGPFIVDKVLPNDRYIIKDIDNCQLSQIPYKGILEAKRLRKWITPN